MAHARRMPARNTPVINSASSTIRVFRQPPVLADAIEDDHRLVHGKADDSEDRRDEGDVDLQPGPQEASSLFVGCAPARCGSSRMQATMKAERIAEA